MGVFEFPYAGLGQFRLTEDRARELAVPQSVWKLNQGVSVGGQTILGIKYLHDLRYQSETRLTQQMSIWPFEAGWTLPEFCDLVIVEIFPSILQPFTNYGGPRDRNQVLTCIEHAARLDGVGQLAERFSQPPGLTDEDSAAVTSEEGWILFT